MRRCRIVVTRFVERAVAHSQSEQLAYGTEWWETSKWGEESDSVVSSRLDSVAYRSYEDLFGETY